MKRITEINNKEINNKGTEKRRAALQSTLQEALAQAAQRDELAIERHADPVDQVQSGTARELASQRLEGLAGRVREIREALERIAGGAYGRCEQCEEPIGEKRLNAVPWVRLCVRCQAEAEGAHWPGAKAA
jgi:DnaK suppressor protein